MIEIVEITLVVAWGAAMIYVMFFADKGDY